MVLGGSIMVVVVVIVVVVVGHGGGIVALQQMMQQQIALIVMSWKFGFNECNRLGQCQSLLLMIGRRKSLCQHSCSI